MKNVPEDYLVARGDDSDELAKSVRYWLLKGYQPHGSVAVTYDAEGYTHSMKQPMVRYAEKVTQ